MGEVFSSEFPSSGVIKVQTFKELEPYSPSGWEYTFFGTGYHCCVSGVSQSGLRKMDVWLSPLKSRVFRQNQAVVQNRDPEMVVFPLEPIPKGFPPKRRAFWRFICCQVHFQKCYGVMGELFEAHNYLRRQHRAAGMRTEAQSFRGTGPAPKLDASPCLFLVCIERMEKLKRNQGLFVGCLLKNTLFLSRPLKGR